MMVFVSSFFLTAKMFGFKKKQIHFSNEGSRKKSKSVKIVLKILTEIAKICGILPK